MLKKYFPKILIVLLAVFFRFWDLPANPSGVYVDEAMQGYNAYSLGLTGKDQYGQPFPLTTKLFATYSSPLYTYYSVLPVSLFDLNILSTRITSAIFGTLLVVLTLFSFGNVAGLVIAIAPVFVFYSRAAFEANLGLFFTVLTLILFRRQKYSLALLILSLSVYAYHAQRLLFLPIAAFYLYKTKFKYFLCLLPALPIFYLSIFTNINARFTELATSPQETVRNLFVYLSPDNLFSRPDPDPQRSFPELSVFYWWMIFPLILGFLNIKSKKIYFLLILLLLLPGAITKDYFSTIRVLPAFYLITLLISRGLVKTKIYIISILILISFFELYSNLVLLKHERSEIWGNPYQQLFSQIQKYSDRKILIDSSRQKPLYILLAFHQRLNPKSLQEILYISNYYQNLDFNPEFTFHNITIRPINWQTDLTKYSIFIGDPLAISPVQAVEHNLTLRESIMFLHIWTRD